MCKFFNRLFNKSAKLATTFVLALALTLSAVPSVFALNQDGISGVKSGHKPLNFTGYQYVDSTHLVINIDKWIDAPKPQFLPGSIDKSMFSLKNHATQAPGPVISSLAYVNDDTTGYSGCTDVNLTKGSKITLTLASPLAADTLYDLRMENTLFANQSLNNFNNTGDPNYYDQTFTFRTPKTDGTYSSTVAPYVTYIIGGGAVSTSNNNRANVSYESNLIIVFDRPMQASARNTYLTALSNNYKRGGVKVTQATGATPPTSDTYECHYPTSNNKNNVNTTFYFPQISQGEGAYSFNRKHPGSYSYTLTLPTSFTDVNGHTFSSYYSAKTNAATTGFGFTTVTNDLPGHCNQLTVAPTATAGQLLVTWNPSKIDPAPTGVKFYVTSGNKWTSYYTLKGYKLHPTQTPTPTTDSYTITGLTSGTLYWVRIAAYNSIGVTGFSQEFSGTPR